MINRYSDHAANERTFLAWVRTAIAVMALWSSFPPYDFFVRSKKSTRLKLTPAQKAGSISRFRF
jgi:putative membrane protein